jgi:hypothetical protein
VKYAAILLLIASWFVACKKEPGPATDPESHLIPAEMKAYWDFKEGSWWAYQDSISGVIDTVKITEYNNYKFSGVLTHSGNLALCEYLEILTYNTNDEYYNRYIINTARSSPEGADYNVVFRSKFGGLNGGSEGGNKCFAYPLVIGLKTYNPLGQFDDTCIVRGYWDSLWGYEKVTMMYQNRNTLDDDQHTRTYWASNVGIIKQVFVDSGVTKTLIDYQIQP